MRAFLLATAACGATQRSVPPKELQLNQAGTMVSIDAALVANYVTIVDFWSDSCGACASVGAKVTAAIANQPNVLFRKIDVGDGFTEVARAYDINALPHYNVYDAKKRLRYVLVGGDCLRAPDLARGLVSER